ncbi:MAG: sigma-70 family RNA polymerase sigma factor [Clostridiales bacterium]|nr:sigma-70 family RNA polymerase sigma factor [Clostridiales bacterium]
MAKIYLENASGKKISVEVSEEIAMQYRDSLQEEWRSNAYESYYTTSLDKITDAGHDFVDENADIEKILIEREEQAARSVLIRKMRAALPKLTDIQRKTIHKIFVSNMSQAEIAKEEGVSDQAISDRMEHLYARLRKILKKI